MIWWHRVEQHVIAVGGTEALRARCKEEGWWYPDRGSEHVVSAVKRIEDVESLIQVGVTTDAYVVFQLRDQIDKTNWFCSNIFEPVRDTSIESLRELLNPTQEQRRVLEDA